MICQWLFIIEDLQFWGNAITDGGQEKKKSRKFWKFNNCERSEGVNCLDKYVQIITLSWVVSFTLLFKLTDTMILDYSLNTAFRYYAHIEDSASRKSVYASAHKILGVRSVPLSQWQILGVISLSSRFYCLQWRPGLYGLVIARSSLSKGGSEVAMESEVALGKGFGTLIR